MTHRQTQPGMAKGRQGSEGDEGDGGGNEPRTYKMAFLTRVEPSSCPVKGCNGRALTKTAMWLHFWHRHVRDTVVILEEGTLPHPRCPHV